MREIIWPLESSRLQNEAENNPTEKTKARAKATRTLWLAVKYGLITAVVAAAIAAGSGLLVMNVAGRMAKMAQ